MPSTIVKSPTALVTAASPLAFRAALKRVRTRFIAKGLWLGERSPYRIDAATALGLNKRRVSIEPRKIAEYIGASIPLHLADGWAYLERAMSSISDGDRPGAIHSAYYAELRAALALLATQGIGVFNKRNVAIDAGVGATEWIGAGTHEDAWDILLAWGAQAGSASSLLRAVFVDGRSLQVLLDTFLNAGRAQPLAAQLAGDWLREWSLDLSRFKSDKVLRNRSSYRPSRIGTPPPTPIDPLAEVLRPMTTIWSALEPIEIGRSAVVDRYLLLKALRWLFPYSAESRWEDAVETLRNHVTITTLRFLVTSGPAGSEHPILTMAADSRSTDDASPMLARAALLLRMASAASADTLTAADLHLGDMTPWWHPLGQDSGLWDVPPATDDVLDMWGEVADGIDSLPTDGDPATTSVLQSARAVAENRSVLKFQTAAFWYTTTT